MGHAVNTIEDMEKASNQLLDKGIKNIIITLGSKGAFLKNEKHSYLIDAYDLKNKVVDTTGAGDAFNGGLAVALVEGLEIDKKDLNN